jgi:hypothetical protein
MRVKLKQSAPILAALCACCLLHARTVSAQDTVVATQTAIIQQDGPKAGDNGTRYFNVEGKSKGKYADYGVAQFDLAALKASLDKRFAGKKHGYKITGVRLDLTQSLASFSAAGSYNIYFADDDSTPIAGLKYPFSPGPHKPTYTQLGSYTFAMGKGPAAPKGVPATRTALPPAAVDKCDLMKLSGTGALVMHIMLGKKLTLYVSEGDPNVAATWAGYTSNRLKPPTLVITAAAVP